MTCNERGLWRGEIEGVLEDANLLLVQAYVNDLNMQVQYGPAWGENDSLL